MHEQDAPPNPSARSRIHRRDGWTPARIRTFLHALRDGASVTAAAVAAGMSRQGAYAFRRGAGRQDFARAWDMARSIARQRRIERNMGPVVDRALRRFRRLVGPRFNVHLTFADAGRGQSDRPRHSGSFAAPPAAAGKGCRS